MSAIVNREQLEAWERSILMPCAQASADSLGRQYPEQEHPLRTSFQRDKDRIIHSTAFRRLEYKTQVFVNHEGDYYRTRLTHTMEVAQIGRTIARSLRLNEDLVEAVSLAHDLGHTPFGHSGEEILHELMKEHGGFEHNAQGLRVVDLLENRYPDFQGLNLTSEVREGIIRHSTPWDHAAISAVGIPVSFPSGGRLLETQVVDIADEIAYNSHDVDDGLESGLLSFEDLREVPLWQKIMEHVESRFADLSLKKKRHIYVRTMINFQVTDVIAESARNLQAQSLMSIADVREHGDNVIRFSHEMALHNKELKAFLWNNLYKHQKVVRMADKAKRIIRDLFTLYVDKPEQLPPLFQERASKESVHRVVSDYIAGMTDRYAYEDYRDLFMPYVVL